MMQTMAIEYRNRCERFLFEHISRALALARTRRIGAGEWLAQKLEFFRHADRLHAHSDDLDRRAFLLKGIAEQPVMLIVKRPQDGARIAVLDRGERHRERHLMVL